MEAIHLGQAVQVQQQIGAGAGHQAVFHAPYPMFNIRRGEQILSALTLNPMTVGREAVSAFLKCRESVPCTGQGDFQNRVFVGFESKDARIAVLSPGEVAWLEAFGIQFRSIQA
jgi:hypothetical protein